MTVAVTGPATNLVLDGSGTASTADDGTTGVVIWITEVSGARLEQIPTAAIRSVQWTDTLGPTPSSTAKLVIGAYELLDEMDPDSYVLKELYPLLTRAPRECQIINNGRVVFWGPVVSVDHTPGSAVADVTLNGCEHWLGRRLVTDVDAESFGIDQIRPPADFTSSPLDIGGDTWQWARNVWFKRAEWRFTAEVFLDSAIDLGAEILRVSIPSNATMSAQSAVVTAGQLTLGAWTTAVVHLTTLGGGAGSLGRTLTVTVGDAAATSAGEVLLREVRAELSPVSVGLDEPDGQAPSYYYARQSWLELIGYVSDLNFVGATESEGRRSQVGWKRPDVYASEGCRMLVEGGDGEMQIRLTPDVRVAELVDIRGVEHAPATLTLDEDTVSRWGNRTVTLGDVTTQWIVANDEGFTGSYQDTGLLGGYRFQSYTAAPTGAAASSLRFRAEQAAKQSKGPEAQQFTVSVDMVKEAVLGVGDRVKVELSDGPTVIDELMRVVSKTVDPAGADFEVVLVPWEE